MNSTAIKATNTMASNQVIFESAVTKEQAGMEKKRQAKTISTKISKTQLILDFDCVKETNRFFSNRMGFSIEIIFDFILALLTFKNKQR